MNVRRWLSITLRREWNSEKCRDCLRNKRFVPKFDDTIKILQQVLVCVRADLRWKNRCQYTSAILFDQNCHQQIPGVDVHCFGVSNDICMRCTSMDMHQVFKGRPISGLPCYANTRAIIYSNSRLLQIYWCMHVIALTFHVLIIDEICFANYNW